MNKMNMKASANRFIRHSAKTKRKPRKIVMVGPEKCGKTALVKRFLDRTFTEQYTATVDDCYNRDYPYRGYKLNLDIVDMSGAFEFPVMRDLQIKTADVIMLVYEVDNLQSAKDVKSLYKIIRVIREDKMPIILVGAKTDLKRGSSPPDNFEESEEIMKVLDEIQGVKHVVTSAKYNLYVRDAFEYGLDDVIKKIHTLSMSAQQTKLNEFEKQKPCCRIL